MSGTLDSLLFQREGSTARLVLNRPDKRNALDEGLIQALKEGLRRADSDPEVRVVTISGAGKDFCAGADLAALRRISDASVLDNLHDVDSLADLFLLIRRISKPVVALVHGRALAGGCGLASACDLVVATESSSFGYPEVRIGFVPAMVMAILRRNISEKRAFEMIATGTIHGAPEAERFGLINRVFPDHQFDSSAAEYVRDIAERSASAVMLGKRLLYHQDGMSFEAAIHAGADLNVLARMTDDTRAGVAAFLSGQRSGE
jgi:methylglutaconyl-CoA hydratase